MRRDPTFWVALAVAFVLGLLPGLGVVAYQRRTADRAASSVEAELQAKTRTWDAERQELTGRVTSAEASAAALKSEVASLSAQVTALKSSPQPEEPADETPRKPPEIVERSIEGSTSAGKPITLVVKVKGEADKVTMRLAKRDDSGWVKTYTLEDKGASAGVHTWRATVTCPTAVGEYRYFADAYLGDAHVTMPGVSAWTILVQ